MRDDAPERNLAVTLAALNAAPEAAAVDAPMRAMAGWLHEALAASTAEESPDKVLRRFLDWLAAVLPRMFPKEADEAAELVTSLTQELLVRGGNMTLLAERAKEWEQQWLHQGIAQGRREGITEGLDQGVERGVKRGLDHERKLLVRLAVRKFDGGTAEQLAARLANIDDFERLDEIGDWIIDCTTGAELLRKCR